MPLSLQSTYPNIYGIRIKALKDIKINYTINYSVLSTYAIE